MDNSVNYGIYTQLVIIKHSTGCVQKTQNSGTVTCSQQEKRLCNRQHLFICV